ncbi:MAG TPA: hypothetical protein VJ942_09090 [Roseovarius sp.]|nr:hypothetical protein [Roseovarius sp.]
MQQNPEFAKPLECRAHKGHAGNLEECGNGVFSMNTAQTEAKSCIADCSGEISDGALSRNSTESLMDHNQAILTES